MMKTLLFPTTIPQQDTLRQLLLFFDEIYQYAPAEDSISIQTPLKNFHHYTPVPFGERLETFQQLIKNITHNRAEYYGGGLSMLSGNATMDVDESTVWSLIESLSPKDTQSKKSQALDHARLLLKLAEISDQEENEITEELSAISKKSKTLLDTLKGEFNGVLDEINPPQAPTSKSASSIEKLIRAWIHLFMTDEQASDFWILTTNQETFEYVSDHASPLIDHRPELLLSLNTPEIASLLEDEFYVKRMELRKDLKETLKNMQQTLRDAAHSGTSSNALKAELKTWQKSSHKVFTGQETRAHIDFYLFPQSVSQLFMKIVKSDLSSGESTDTPPHAIIAVLR